MSASIHVSNLRKRGVALGTLFAVSVSLVVLSASIAFAQSPPSPPSPPGSPPGPPPRRQLSQGPVEFPKIPSRRQVLPRDLPTFSSLAELPARRVGASVEARLLVVSADGTEPVLGAIRQALDYAGTPYTLYVARNTPGGFTPALLRQDADHAKYQGIILTTGSLAYFDGTAWPSAFNNTEWQTLWDYQAEYAVRVAIAYAYPTADLGYGPATEVDTGTNPVAATLTPSGAAMFRYLNAANPLVIRGAWAYLARASGPGTHLVLGDAAGNALGLIRTHPDGRMVLSFTFDGNPYMVHSLALMHGLLDWVSGGVFLGERHVHLAPQVDDIFLDNDVYGGGIYRINSADWTANINWQNAKQQQPQTQALHLHMAFNGEGTTGIYSNDTLTPAARNTQAEFPWINHTFTHENLDATSYNVTTQEITRNNDIAATMGFSNHDPRALVTGDVSGLYNAEAMRAAFDAGIRFLVTDTSRPGQDNPSPQAGIPNWSEPGILMVPRRPTNLFYNASTRTQWRGQYNDLYRSHWGRDLSYAEILDKESDVLLQYLLRGEVDPWMFHQSNLRAYDGVHTLLGDLLDRTLDKYRAIFTLPIRSLTLAQLGEWTQRRMDYAAGGVRATLAPDERSITLTATRAAVVPVTGLCTATAEQYGGQCISHVALAAGQTVVLSLDAPVAGTPDTPGEGAVAQAAIQAATPNPFRAAVTISLALPSAAASHLAIYDLAGRVVRTLVNRVLEAGSFPITWDGRADDGTPVAGGVYFAKFKSGAQASVRRIVLVK